MVHFIHFRYDKEILSSACSFHGAAVAAFIKASPLFFKMY